MTEQPAARALVVGEALVDVVLRPGAEPAEHPGGSPANVAIGHGRLGRRVDLLTWLGDDAHGDLVRERTGIERQAEDTLERTRREVEFEVARTRRGVEVAEALVKTAAEARSLAEQTDQLTRRSLESGRSGSLELVQSAAALRQAELALALREFELVQARLDAFLTEARCDWGDGYVPWRHR